MLSKADKDKIIELRQQDFSYQAIHEKLGFAIETIRKVIKEEKERKAKELVEEKNRQAEKDRLQKDVVSFDSSISKVRKIESDIDDVIESGELKAGDRREWEQRKEDLRTALKEEVDDIRADAFETRDIQWRELIRKNYVQKEKATELENTIKARDAAIIELKNEIVQKDELLSNNQYEISQLNTSHRREKEGLKNQIGDLLGDNNFFSGENWRLYEYIENRLDVDVRQWQGQLCYEQENLNNKKTDFDQHVKTQEKRLNELFIEADKKQKDVERREKELAEKEDKFKKQEDNFHKNINQILDKLKERIKDVEKREKNAKEMEKRCQQHKKNI